MKTFIKSVYFGALILMFPALFVGYLYSNNSTNTNQQNNSQIKASISANSETAFKPEVLFVVKGL